ncbi:MAG TPA: S8 family serine peptidase [Planctomycetota bacterium]|nr:S8 family serine peptidase [Planctomycetota bacterium]
MTPRIRDAFVRRAARAAWCALLVAIPSVGQDLATSGADALPPSAVPADARRIAVGPTRTVVAAWTVENASWYAASVDGGLSWSAPRAADYEVKVHLGAFDPLRTTPVVPRELAAGPASRLHIVQFHAPGLPDQVAELAAYGASPLFYLPSAAYVVEADSASIAALRAAPFVRWIGPYHPAYRLFPEDLSALLAGVAPEGAPWNVVCTRSHDLAAKRRIADDLAAYGAAEFFPVAAEARLLTLSLSQAAALAALRHDDVAWIDRWSPPEDDMDIARQFVGATYVATPAVGSFTGQDVRGQVLDGGTLQAHVDFSGLLWQGVPVATGASTTSHGTSTYGIVFGKGVGNPQGLGLLPQAAQGIAASYNDPLASGNRYAFSANLVQAPFEGMFQSNSWGSTLTANYTSISQSMDDIVFGLDLLIFQSQSNAGTTQSRPQAWAKNVVSVGGVKHKGTLTRADDDWTGGGSIGPAADGRIKPDVSNFYDGIFTTSSSSPTSYTSSFGGTSGATPITAGCGGLLIQMWTSGVFGPPRPGVTAFQRRPHAATLKALMINTATQYAFSGTAHDLTRTHQGWGTADVQRAYDLAAAGKILVVDETRPLAALQTAVYTVTVPAGEPEFRATLCYGDPGGTTAATQHRINNVDLRVTAPGGTTYWGNNGLLAGNWSTSGGVANGLDTVENVLLQNPAPGTWTIEVIAAEINADGRPESAAIDVDFALVVSGGTPSYAVGAGQANAAVAALDVNGGTSIGGQYAGFGIAGPFAASAGAGGQLQFAVTGEPNRPFALLSGPLNVGNLLIPPIGSLDLGLSGPGNLNDVAVLLDGISGTTFFDLMANTGTFGGRYLAFPLPALPPGPFAAFQAVVVPTTGLPLLTAAFDVTVQ